MLHELERLYLRREMTPQHRHQLLHHLKKFATWSRDDFESFNDDTLNEWLANLESLKKWKPKTIRHYRASVLNAWRTAYRAGLVESLPGEIRTVRLRRRPPEAWTTEELRRLVDACDNDEDGDWMRAYILVVWCTALRMNDAITVCVARLAPGRIWHLSQNKTGEAHSVRLSEEAVHALTRIDGQFSFRSRHQISKRIIRLKKVAKVSRGTARWIRRSAASYVEKERPGFGARLLGHRTPGMAERHYFDPSIIGNVVAGPALPLSKNSEVPKAQTPQLERL